MLERTFENFRIKAESLAKEELASRFGRMSPDICLRIFSHVDSSLLISSTRVSRSWSEAIQGCTELFHKFEMDGKGEQICEGLELFNGKSKNSEIQSIKLKVKDELSSDPKVELGESIRQSFETLETLSVAHQGDLEEMLVGVVGEDCHSLKVLEITRVGLENALPSPRPYSYLSSTVQFATSWRARLDTLVFKAVDFHLECNEDLLGILQDRCHRCFFPISFDSFRLHHHAQGC